MTGVGRVCEGGLAAGRVDVLDSLRSSSETTCSVVQTGSKLEPLCSMSPPLPSVPQVASMVEPLCGTVQVVSKLETLHMEKLHCMDGDVLHKLEPQLEVPAAEPVAAVAAASAPAGRICGFDSGAIPSSIRRPWDVFLDDLWRGSM